MKKVLSNVPRNVIRVTSEEGYSYDYKLRFPCDDGKQIEVEF